MVSVWKTANLTLPGTDPAWGMAYTVIAHHMLDWYGDLRAVEEQYAGLVLYMRYLRNIPGVDPVVAPFNHSGLLTYQASSSVYWALDMCVAGPSEECRCN